MFIDQQGREGGREPPAVSQHAVDDHTETKFSRSSFSRCLKCFFVGELGEIITKNSTRKLLAQSTEISHEVDRCMKTMAET